MAKPTKAMQLTKVTKLSPKFKRKADTAAAPPAKKARSDQDKGSDREARQNSSSKDKRAAVREKKLLHKKNWNVIQDAVYLWEKLRPKETPDAERKDLVSDIIKKVKGKLLELSNHHTASRVIQFCVKYGSDAERRTVMDEVRANVIELSKSKYGHFLVRKLVNSAKKDDIPGLVRLFRGHVAQLLRQPYGADVVTDLYDVASTTDRNALSAEFYGKEYVLFDGISGEAGRLHSLEQLMAVAPKAKQRSIIQHMSKSLTPIMEKALLHPPMTHRLVKEYLECSTGLSVEQAVETLSQTGEAVLRMVHTHEGATAVCMVLAYGNPRDRKRVVRAMKGHVAAMAADEWGHTALCMALACVDDTSLTGKVLVPEIKELLAEGVHQATMVRVLMQLLAPNSRRHFPPAIHDILHPPQRTVRGSSGKSVTDIDGEEEDTMDFHADGAAEGGDEGDDLFTAKKGKAKAAKSQPKKKLKLQPGTADDDEGGAGGSADPQSDGRDEDGSGQERVLGASKKDPIVRRRELLGSGPKSLSARITSVVASVAPDLLRSAHSCELVVEVARGGEQGLLHELDAAGVQSVHIALVEDAARSAEEIMEEADEEENGPTTSGREHLLLSYFSSRALRRLLLAASEETCGGAASAFAEHLWSGALRGRCKKWVGTHAEKVLAALLHCGVPSVVQAASNELKPLVKQPLEEWGSRFLTQKGKDGEGNGHQKGVAEPPSVKPVSKGTVRGKGQISDGPMSSQPERSRPGKRSGGDAKGKLKQAK